MLLTLLPEIQNEIFFYCNLAALENLSLCSSLCREACKMFFWKSVSIPFKELSNIDFMNDKRIEFLMHAQILTLRSHPTIEDSAKSIVTRNCINLAEHCNPKVLNVFYLPSDSLATFATNFNKLETIEVATATWRDNATDASLMNISTMLTLKEVIVKHCDISDVGIKYLHSLVQLEKLDINYCYQITDAGLRHVSEMVSLKDLDIGGLDRVTDIGISLLPNLIQLEKLDMSWCDKVTDFGLEHISKMVALKELKIEDCDKVTDIGISRLPNLVRLEKLNVVSCYQITDVGLEHISKMASLNNLNVKGCFKVTNVGMGFVSKMASLKRLNVDRCDMVTDFGLELVSKMVSLEM